MQRQTGSQHRQHRHASRQPGSHRHTGSHPVLRSRIHLQARRLRVSGPKGWPRCLRPRQSNWRRGLEHARPDTPTTKAHPAPWLSRICTVPHSQPNIQPLSQPLKLIIQPLDQPMSLPHNQSRIQPPNQSPTQPLGQPHTQPTTQPDIQPAT